MAFQDQLQEYARLTVKEGVCVTSGIYVLIRCPVIAADFGRMVMEEAFRSGAKDVIMLYSDEKTARVRYEHAALSQFETYPAWQAEQSNFYAREGTVCISIVAEDPEAFTGIDGQKLLANTKARRTALKEFYDTIDAGNLRWTIVAYPCIPWAKKVFPGETDEAAVEKLWNAIFETVRITEDASGALCDTVQKWKQHDKILKDRAAKLNQYAFASLHYKNSLGTDFRIGLPKNHIWYGGSETSGDGYVYFPNMPTEEIFTMPHRLMADGVLCASMPLSYQGCLIEDFSLTFMDGHVVSHRARVGEDALTRLLDTDEGSRRLGEVALIPYDSPIRAQNILYYNTLFDENASCHFALGDCYPNTLKGGELLPEAELEALGGNHSVNHVDFMIGTADLTVIGTTHDGQQIPVFENGNFVF